MKQFSSYDVLLVEDDLGDAGLTRVALKQSKYPCRVHHVGDGRQALEFLRRMGNFADAPKPHLVLLDLNMPRVSGREVLAELQSDAELRRIPVVVLTTSDVEADVEACYLLGANSFITKPSDFDDFMSAIQGISEFWFSVAQLPS